MTKLGVQKQDIVHLLHCSSPFFYFSKLDHYNDNLRKLVWKAKGDKRKVLHS